MATWRSGDSEVRRLVNGAYDDAAWHPAGRAEPITAEQAAASSAVLHLDRKLKRRGGRLGRQQRRVQGSYGHMTMLRLAALEDAPALPAGHAPAQPELSLVLLHVLAVVVFGADFTFFFAVYCDVLGVEPNSVGAVSPGLLALLTPLFVLAVAVPLGRRIAGWRVGASTGRREAAVTGGLGVLLLALMWAFEAAATHRFDSAATQVAAAKAPTFTVVVLGYDTGVR